MDTHFKAVADHALLVTFADQISDDGAVRQMRTRIGLLVLPESIRSIIDAAQRVAAARFSLKLVRG